MKSYLCIRIRIWLQSVCTEVTHCWYMPKRALGAVTTNTLLAYYARWLFFLLSTSFPRRWRERNRGTIKKTYTKKIYLYTPNRTSAHVHATCPYTRVHNWVMSLVTAHDMKSFVYDRTVQCIQNLMLEISKIWNFEFKQTAKYGAFKYLVNI